MIPPAPLPPDDSTCWQWWNPPADGILPPGAAKPPTGCDYSPCQNAVCVCDNYCCETAWDLSCRGYYAQVGDGEENNYFVPGCSAKLLCCEPESAFPDPPVGASIASNNAVSIAAPLSNSKITETSYQCEPGSPGCCETMIPPSYLPPDNSTCWQWFTPPESGVLIPGDPTPPKGCDYKPCQDAVCACDDYCCNVAWDLSCRGYEGAQGDNSKNNYFVDDCSAKILCCEPESAYPDPPLGGTNEVTAVSEERLNITVPVPVALPVPTVKLIPVPVPVPTTKVIPVPIQVPTTPKIVTIPVPRPVQVQVEYNTAPASTIAVTNEESYVCQPGSPGCCETLIPPSLIPPNDSTCWQWWNPPADGVLTPDMAAPPKGCDYTPCQNAVCACDPYCCNTAWDLSCRGYTGAQGDESENNYFVSECSSKILCCEPDTGVPKPPIGGVASTETLTKEAFSNETIIIPVPVSTAPKIIPVPFAVPTIPKIIPVPVPVSVQVPTNETKIIPVPVPTTNVKVILVPVPVPISIPVAVPVPNIIPVPKQEFSFQCTPGSPGCCETLIPPSIRPPNDSTCWLWWVPPADGVMKPDMPEPPKGCDYSPCQDAVCACDSYCCDVAWDMSCRGYEGAQGDSTENNYFVDNCSAKILCCEPELGVPKPPIGGVELSTSTTSPTNSPSNMPVASPISLNFKVPIPTDPPVPTSTVNLEVNTNIISSQPVSVLQPPVSNPVSININVPFTSPIPLPTSSPTTAVPSHKPSKEDSVSPSDVMTYSPSSAPITSRPSDKPTKTSSNSPSTKEPTLKPTEQSVPEPITININTNILESTPTNSPTNIPTSSPTISPTVSPTEYPTSSQTLSPTVNPTSKPTESPVTEPITININTNIMESTPTNSPTNIPTSAPTTSPTVSPTDSPTSSQTLSPTINPTSKPTKTPVAEPITININANVKETIPTNSPTNAPTSSPTDNTDLPTKYETNDPTIAVSEIPSTSKPSSQPVNPPVVEPITININSNVKVTAPTSAPTNSPTSSPTTNPTVADSTQPSEKESSKPSVSPVTEPITINIISNIQSTTPLTTSPTHLPTSSPTELPTVELTSTPTNSPTPVVTSQPVSDIFAIINTNIKSIVVPPTSSPVGILSAPEPISINIIANVPDPNEPDPPILTTPSLEPQVVPPLLQPTPQPSLAAPVTSPISAHPTLSMNINVPEVQYEYPSLSPVSPIGIQKIPVETSSPICNSPTCYHPLIPTVDPQSPVVAPTTSSEFIVNVISQETIQQQTTQSIKVVPPPTAGAIPPPVSSSTINVNVDVQETEKNILQTSTVGTQTSDDTCNCPPISSVSGISSTYIYQSTSKGKSGKGKSGKGKSGKGKSGKSKGGSRRGRNLQSNEGYFIMNDGCVCPCLCSQVVTSNIYVQNSKGKSGKGKSGKSRRNLSSKKSSTHVHSTSIGHYSDVYNSCRCENVVVSNSISTYNTGKGKKGKNGKKRRWI